MFKFYLEDINKITWIKPDFTEESGEYFDNDYTQEELKKRNIIFKTEEDLITFLQNGEFKTMSPNMIKKYTNMTLDKEEFQQELKDDEYRKSYEDMLSKLKNQSALNLPSPILIETEPEHYFGFAGNRRTNLGFNTDGEVNFWVVKGYK